MTVEEAKEELIQSLTENHIPDPEAVEMGIKALEQMSCEDDYIKVPKNALKYRTAGMIAYNAEWLKNHFDIERAVICGTQETCDVFDEYGNYKYPSDVELTEPNTATSMPCEDAIGRSDMLDAIGHGTTYTSEELQKIIKGLPPVNPQPKTGQWFSGGIQGEIDGQIVEEFICSECGAISVFRMTGGKTINGDLCPNCGAKMQEVEDGKDD